MTVRPSSLRIIEVSDIEPYRERLVRFWQKFLVPDFPDSRIEWLYGMNPYGPTYTWLALNNEDEIAGCGSLYQRTFYSYGTAIHAGMAVDFGVDERYRVFGPAVDIQRKIVSSCKEKGFDVLFVTPNRKAFGVFERVGFKHVGKSTQWLLVLNSYKWILKHLKSPVLSRIVATCVDSMMTLVFYAQFKFRYMNYYGKVSENGFCDFDEVWKSGYTNYRFLPDKSAGYLNWYYANNKERRYHFFSLYYKKSDSMCGYLVYYEEEGCVVIADMFTPNENGMCLLLWHFVKFLKKQNTPGVRLNYLGCSSFLRSIRWLGFVRVKHFRDYLIYFTPDILQKYLPLVDDCSSLHFFK